MTAAEFLIQFSTIEKKLFSLAPNFDNKKGFTDLLRYLQMNNLVANDLLLDLHDIFKLRNQIASSPSGEINITPEIINKIQKVKQVLKI